MANVNIKFNGKDYLLSCDDGQEESLKKLSKMLKHLLILSNENKRKIKKKIFKFKKKKVF